MRRWKQVNVVETARRDIDETPAIAMLIRQRRAADGAERASNRLGRVKLRRMSAEQPKFRDRKCNPGDDRRSCDATTALAVADHAVRGRATDAIPNGTADAPAFSR